MAVVGVVFAQFVTGSEVHERHELPEEDSRFSSRAVLDVRYAAVVEKT